MKVNFAIYLSEKDDLDLIDYLDKRPEEFENDNTFLKYLLRKAMTIEIVGNNMKKDIDKISSNLGGLFQADIGE